MSGRQITRLRIEMAPSRMLAGLLLVTHAGALFVVASALAPLQVQLPVCAGLIGHGGWMLWRHVLLRHSRSIVVLEFSAEARCVAHRADGTALVCRVRPSSYLTAWLIVLDLERQGYRRGERVVILPDSISVESHRRLRVRLRWSRLGASPDSGAGARL